jgi:uncharacterized phiE125 gp8 family phage protein
MSLTLITAPTVEPVSIVEAKLHARIITGNNATKAITAIARASGVVTATATAHGLTAGQFAIVQNVLDGSFNGVFAVSSAPDANTLVWAQAGLNATSSGGTVALAGAEDYKIWDLIKTARESVEAFTRTRLITQKWRYQIDGFPRRSPAYEDHGFGFYLPGPPFRAITLFEYVDSAGNVQTLTLAQANGETSDGSYGYQVDAGFEERPARVFPSYNLSWPSTRQIPNAVKVELTCGYGDTASSVPGTLRLGMMEMISDWYYNREPRGVISTDTQESLKAYRNLIS